ncbi:MAG: hypothetical protein BWY83_01859 [bacterium ADurb.Bin478]|nr:MAG: hypothetical protein BWY83_01859 [bacterium ADurb.Bin478]
MKIFRGLKSMDNRNVRIMKLIKSQGTIFDLPTR